MTAAWRSFAIIACIVAALLLATVDRDVKSGPFARVAFGLGAIIDASFSIAFDTLLLPVDMVRAKRCVDERDINGDKGAANNSE